LGSTSLNYIYIIIYLFILSMPRGLPVNVTSERFKPWDTLWKPKYAIDAKIAENTITWQKNNKIAQLDQKKLLEKE